MSVTEQGSQAIRPTVRWTGHPFVDAGLAALATVSGVSQLEDLTADHLPEAVTALERVLLSDQALGLGVTNAFVRKGLSQIFPNSELVNPSNWKGETLEQKADSVRRKFRDAVAQELRLAQECLGFTTSNTEMCSTCGQRRPVSAMVTMRKDDLPLLAGIVNFYPAFDVGVRLCGLCALAVRFLPLSVMRTGVWNRLWILHTHAFPIARGISLQYGWIHFNQRIAANDALDFFKDWETAGDAGTVIYLLCDLLDRFSSQLQHLYRHPLPTTAYIFSNDNRSSHIQALLVPDSLLEFLAMLQILSPSAYKRFWRDLLVVPRTLAEKERGSRIDFVQKVAQSLLNSRAVLTFCLDHDTPKLSGGWMGHRLYLQEVLQMAVEKLAILERLGLTIARDPEAKRLIGELRTARWNEIHGILLRYVRQGWLSHEEFYTLLPPNSYGTTSHLRDIILAVAYEWVYAQQQGQDFPSTLPTGPLTADETLTRLQQIGERLIASLPNLSRWIGQLQTARTWDRIRGVYLTAVQRGALGYADFVFLAPLEDQARGWLLRDYLLAFLFDRARAVVPLEEIAEPEQIAQVPAGEATEEI